MILYKKAGLWIAELWFDEEPNGARVDIIRYMQRTTPITQARCWNFHTMVIDLNRDPDLLRERMKKDTRYEIRRAETKDRLTYHLWPEADANCLARFISFYDVCAAWKNLPRVGHARLREFSKIGMLTLSEVLDEAGTPITWHAYYRTKCRVRLLHSASLTRGTDNSSRRSTLGRANRFHHWRDIMSFRDQGVLLYDFGGWYEGKSDQKRLSINKFKEEFGGKTVLNYNGRLGVTLAGRAAIWLHEWLRPGS